MRRGRRRRRKEKEKEENRRRVRRRRRKKKKKKTRLKLDAALCRYCNKQDINSPVEPTTQTLKILEHVLNKSLL